MQHFRYLKAWQSALLLAEEIRATVARFPRRGYAELKAQMTASAESIGHNIAEGRTEAASDKEYIRFLNHALRSAGELESQVWHAEAYRIIPERKRHHLISKIICTIKLITALRDSIEDDLKASAGPGKSPKTAMATPTAKRPTRKRTPKN